MSFYEITILIAGAIGIWLKFQQDYNKLSSRVYKLESDHSELKQDLKQLITAVQEIKLLLAKNKVE